jgi:protein-L-isoaspartate(D-aspartate) O-methyltransferase
VALEQDADLTQAARAALSGQASVTVVSGALTAGWPQSSPYDAIVLEGATEIPPVKFLSQLKEGGRLVCVLGGGPGAKAMLYCRSGDELGGRPIFDATAAVLPGFAETPVFAF